MFNSFLVKTAIFTNIRMPSFCGENIIPMSLSSSKYWQGKVFGPERKGPEGRMAEEKEKDF